MNKIFSSYFHLIRHPREAERKRDKLLTAIAILSCITAIVPAVLGIGYALAGRVKRPAEPDIPIGFRNYGLACWFTSAIQVLLSSQHFEDVVSQPLMQEKGESGTEFEARKGFQRDFLKFLEEAKTGDSLKVNQAVKRLHERIVQFFKEYNKRPLQPKIHKVGSPGDPYSLLDSIHHITGLDYRYGHLLAVEPDSESQFRFKDRIVESFKESPTAPKMFYFVSDEVTKLPLNLTLTLSGGFGTAAYRLVGVCKGPSKFHNTATVLRNGKWYDCDDSRVKLEESDTLHLKNDCRLLFDLVEQLA